MLDRDALFPKNLMSYKCFNDDNTTGLREQKVKYPKQKIYSEKDKLSSL